MDFIGGAVLIAMGIYFGMLAIARSIIHGAVLLSGRRDIEKQIEES